MKQIGIIIAGILFFEFSLKTIAQENDQFDFFNDDISTMLVPLGVMIDSALVHDPYVRFRDLQLVVNQCKLKAEQSQWMRNVGFQSDVRYGTFDNFSTNTSEGQTPSVISTRTDQTNYGIGAYIKFPVFDLVSRKNQITLAKTELEQAESMARVQRKEVRELVIKQYHDLILKQRLLKIRSKYMEAARINFMMVEKEFQNGVVDITEYARISEIKTRAESDFEKARTEFITTYLILEEIVGFKFNLVNIQ
jgi:outer membrane protein TolC